MELFITETLAGATPSEIPRTLGVAPSTTWRGAHDLAVVKDLYTTIDVDIGETVAVERILGHVDGDVVGVMDRPAYGVLLSANE